MISINSRVQNCHCYSVTGIGRNICSYGSNTPSIAIRGRLSAKGLDQARSNNRCGRSHLGIIAQFG
ncbi:hypothetical protein D3C81_2223270 [compost metagenome]